MSKKVTFATLSANFDKLCDEVVKHRKPIIIDRRDKPSVVLISAKELSSLTETVHLLTSSKNAVRLL